VSCYQGASRLEARRRLGLPADATVLLAGAYRLDEVRKGYDHLCEALGRLAQDPKLRQQFQTGSLICATFGDGERAGEIPIRSLGRLTGDAQMALAYRSADLFLLPTLEDNLPNTLLESIAAGTPVVAYATGGVPDVLEHGRCGIVVPRGDAGAFATAIRSLLDAPAERHRLGEQCEPRAREAFDSAVQGRAYLRLYQKLLQPDRTRGECAPVPVNATRPEEALASSESRFLRRVLASSQLTERTIREWTSELHTVQDGWRVTRETLHQAEQHLIVLEEDKERAAREHAEAIATREREKDRQIEALRTTIANLTADNARLAAERGALKKRVTRSMTRVVIFGAGDRARLFWEALTLAGSADVVAFVDTDPRRHGRPLLSSTVQPMSWLTANRWDFLAVSTGDLSSVAGQSALAGVDRARILPLPDDDTAAGLARYVASRLPDPLLNALSALPARAALRIGIFGTGSAAMKVWEAIAEIDEADAVWFADNNPQQHGRALLWLEVIAPDRIHAHSFDAIVIGSMSRDAIHQQLRRLGIPGERILAPDVSSPVDRIREQLADALAQRLFREVA
jgi:hypothetical protein